MNGGTTFLLALFVVGIAVSVRAKQTRIWELLMITTFGLLLATTNVGGKLTGLLGSLGSSVGRLFGAA